MKIVSLIPALYFLLFPNVVFAADINLELLNQDDYLTINVNISGLERTSCKDSTCYLQGMFTSTQGSPKYFGYTFGQYDWFIYDGSPEKEFIKSNFVPFETSLEGSWSGVIRLKPDKNDPDYKGPGEYLIKVRRYTGESTGPATDDINILTVNLNEPTPSPTGTPTPAPTNTPSPSPTISSTPTPVKTPSATASPTPVVTKTPSVTKTPTPEPSVSPQVVSPTTLLVSPSTAVAVLGESTDSSSYVLNLNSPTPTTDSEKSSKSNQKSSSTFRNLALAGVILSTVSGGALYLRRRRVKIQ